MKIFFHTTLSFMLILPNMVFSAVSISEIMYDASGNDSGREWVELYNSGGESLDISSYRISEKSVNHKFKLIQGNAVMGEQSFAVIADDAGAFLLDHPRFDGTLFDSSFSMNNSAGIIILKNKALAIVDSASYSESVGAGGDGDSLQRFGGMWKTSSPTPGSENLLKIDTRSVESSAGDNTSADSASVVEGESRATQKNNSKNLTANVTAQKNNKSSGALFRWGIVAGGTAAALVASYIFTPSKKTEQDEADEYKIIDE